MIIADSGGLSWREPREERERGTNKVVLTGLSPKANPEAVAILIARQKEIDQSEAWAEVAQIAEGQPIQCLFTDPGKARLFAVVCRVKGAICEVFE